MQHFIFNGKFVQQPGALLFWHLFEWKWEKDGSYLIDAFLITIYKKTRKKSYKNIVYAANYSSKKGNWNQPTTFLLSSRSLAAMLSYSY